MIIFTWTFILICQYLKREGGFFIVRVYSPFAQSWVSPFSNRLKMRGTAPVSAPARSQLQGNATNHAQYQSISSCSRRKPFTLNPQPYCTFLPLFWLNFLQANKCIAIASAAPPAVMIMTKGLKLPSRRTQPPVATISMLWTIAPISSKGPNSSEELELELVNHKQELRMSSREPTTVNSGTPQLRSKQVFRINNATPASLRSIHSSKVSKPGAKRPTRLCRDVTKLIPTTDTHRLTRKDTLGTSSTSSADRKAMQQFANASLRRSTRISKQP